MAPVRAQLPDYDESLVLAERSGGPVAAPAAATRELDPRGGRLTVASRDPIHGVPTFVWGDFARPDAPEVLGAGASALSALGPGPRAERVARAHLARVADLMTLTAADVEGAALDHVHDIGRGPVIVTFVQRVGGVEVEGARLVVGLDRDLALVAISGRLPGQAALREPARREFALSPASSVERASRDMGQASPLANSGWARCGERDGVERYDRTERLLESIPYDPSLAPVAVRRVFVEGPYGLEAAHLVEMAGTNEAYATVWSAVDGRLMRRTNIMSHVSHVYRVFAEPTPPYRPLQNPAGAAANPITQLPGDLTIPPFVPPVLVTLDHGPTPTSDPWLEPGSTTTISNHADAYADLAAPDGYGAGDVRAPLSSPLAFDWTYDTALTPTATITQRYASIVNAFYAVNWLHDWFYAAGFNELSGNAQASNLGRGGLGNDRMLVEIQDFSGNDNATMMTANDGVSPRMQLFRYMMNPPGVTAPERDTGLDFGLVAHEWGHYLSNRLSAFHVPGTMKEGYSDFVELLTGIQAQDTLAAGNAGFGGRYGAARYPSARWDFGVRRYPYSVDTTWNALRFRHIQSGQPLPSSPKNPRTGSTGDPSSNHHPHRTGEVWCTMLWDAFHTLLNRPGLGVEPARERMRDYLVASLKLLPNQCGFTHGRDALLAVVAASHPEEVLPMAEAFARRGLGSAAQNPPFWAATNTPLVESYDVGRSFEYVGAQLLVGAVDCDGDTYLDPEEEGVVRVTARNTGPLILTGVHAGVTTLDPRIVFLAGDDFPLPAIPPFSIASVDIPVGLLGVTDSATVTFTVTMGAYDEVIAPNPVVRAHGFKVAVDLRTSYTDDFEFPEFVWTLEGTGSDPVQDWRVVPVGDDGAMMQGPTYPIPGLESAIAPPANLPAGTHTITFRTAYDFDASDGGVVQYRTCPTCPWQDLTTGPPNAMPYPGTVPFFGENPLGGKSAFVGRSPGYPELQSVSFQLPVATPTTVWFRLVVGSDSTGAGGEGLFVDDFSIPTASAPPFIGEARDSGACTPTDVGSPGDVRSLDLVYAGANPTRGRAHLRLAVPRAMVVDLAMYDLSGRRVAVLMNGERQPGWHEVEWRPANVGPGVYFARLATPMGVRVRRIVMLR